MKTIKAYVKKEKGEQFKKYCELKNSPPKKELKKYVLDYLK